MSSRFLAIDLETTGRDPLKHRITEIGWCLQSYDEDAPLRLKSDLILPADDEPPMDDEVIAVTGITDGLRREFGVPLHEALRDFHDAARKADYVVAHKAGFERSFLGVHAFGDPLDPLSRYSWIDTLEDIPYPASIGENRTLIYLCAVHGFLNPFSHRAVFDAMSAAKLLRCYPLDEVVRRSRASRIRLMAWGLPYDRREEAKALRFHWDPARKVWFKEIREYELESLGKAFTFPITIEEVK